MQADTATALATAHATSKQDVSELIAAGQPQDQAAKDALAQEQTGNVLKIAPSRPKINRPPSKHITAVVDPLAEDPRQGLPKRSSALPPKQRQWDVKFAIILIVLVVMINLTLTVLLGNQGGKAPAADATASKRTVYTAVPVKKNSDTAPLANTPAPQPKSTYSGEPAQTIYTAPQTTPSTANKGRPGVDYPVAVTSAATPAPQTATTKAVPAQPQNAPVASTTTIKAAPVPAVAEIAPLPAIAPETTAKPVAASESYTPPPSVTVSMPVEPATPVKPVAASATPVALPVNTQVTKPVGTASATAPVTISTTPAPTATPAKRPGVDFPVAVAPATAEQPETAAKSAPKKPVAEPVATYQPESTSAPVTTYTRQTTSTASAPESAKPSAAPVNVIKSEEEKAQLLKIINQY